MEWTANVDRTRSWTAVIDRTRSWLAIVDMSIDWTAELDDNFVSAEYGDYSLDFSQAKNSFYLGVM